MVYSVLITPDANKQIEQAVQYYSEHVSKKVALDFLKDYRQAVSEIVEVRYFQVFYLDFRVRLMKKFPYLVFYSLDEERKLIIIKAVFHTSQHPSKYPKR